MLGVTLAHETAADEAPSSGRGAADVSGPSGVVADSDADADVPIDRRVSGDLVMHFRDAPLRAILEHLSEEAGLAVVDGVDLDERVTVFSRRPVTIDEAVALLNTVLYEHGYAAIRRQQVLRIVPLAQAKRSSIPVRVGDDPEVIGESDQIITQIVPVRFADASDLVDNVRNLLSADHSEISANENSNSLIVTDTEANVRRIVQIVRALDQSMAEARDVRVFHLQYADAAETARLITETFRVSDGNQRQTPRRWPGQTREDTETSSGLDREVRAAADSRGNSVVVSATPAALQLVTRVIEDLDRDTTAQEAVLVYHARNATASELESLFNTLFAQSTSRDQTQQQRRYDPRRRDTGSETEGSASDLVGNVTAVADAATNTLLVLTAEANFPRIESILEQLDRPVPQVLVRVLVAELSHERARDIGVELAADGRVDRVLLEGLTTFGAPDSGLNFMVLHNDYSASLHALEIEGVLDVLSRPYILTRDNREANILVGEEFPFVTATRVTDVGTVINTIDHRDIGIILGVTPQINTEGLVVMDVSQELSAFQMSTVEITDGVKAPRIAKRTADTRVAVNDGQTVVIGGLMQDQFIEHISKVPLLGDIPLLGELFKRTQSERSKTELLLFLTPEVIMDPADLVQMSDRVRGETEHIDQAVEPGAMQRHLDRMGAPASPAGGDAEPVVEADSEDREDSQAGMLEEHLERMRPFDSDASERERRAWEAQRRHDEQR